MSEKLHEGESGRQSGPRDFLVGLTGTAGQDIKNWAEAVGPIILFGMVCVNALIAFGSWWMAADAFFPDLTRYERIGAAAVGGLLVGFIDWMVVSYHPSLPSWFTSGSPEPPPPWWAFWRRTSGISTTTENTAVVPRMPHGWGYVRPYLARMALAAVIALFIGTGVSIAANKPAVEEQREQDAILATREEEDRRFHYPSVEANTAARQILKEWQDANEKTLNQIGELNSQYQVVQTALDNLELRIKCESTVDRPALPQSAQGVCTNDLNIPYPTQEGYERAVRDTDRDKPGLTAQAETLSGTIKQLQDDLDVGKPEVPPIVPKSTTNEPNDAFNEGLGPTLNAYIKVATSWPWYLEWGVLVLLLAFDLAPVFVKMMFGYPISDHRAWNRHCEATLRRLEGTRQLRLQAAPDEVGLAQHLGNLAAARVVAAETPATARASALASRDEQIVTAREAAQAERPSLVAAAEEEARLSSQARTRIAEARAEHDVQQVLLDLEADTARRASRRETASSPPLATPDGPIHPSESEGTPTADEETPSESGYEVPRSSSRQAQAPWSPAARFPKDSVWRDPSGDNYLIGPSIVPNDGRGYSNFVVRVMVRIPLKDGTEISADAMPSYCRILKQIPLAGPEHQLSNALPQSGQAFETDWVAPYYPRTDLVRYLSQLGHQHDSLQFKHVVEWGRDLLSDLRILHQLGWAHNDIKAQNVVLSGPARVGSTEVDSSLGQLHLIDFGSAARLGKLGMGTPSWLAPERRFILNDRLPQPSVGSPPADIFSVAAVLFYAVTGRRVNEVVSGVEGDQRELMWVMSQRDWSDQYRAAWERKIPEMLTGVPNTLVRQIIPALDPDPEGRPVLEEFRENLGAILPDPALARGFTPDGKDVRPSGFSQPIMEIFSRVGYIIGNGRTPA